MKIELVSEIKSGVVVDFLQKKDIKHHELKKTLHKANFDASAESVCFLYDKGALVCGIEDDTTDSIRSAATIAIQTLKTSNALAATIDVNAENLQAVVEGVILGGYEFNKYKSKVEKSKLKNVYLKCDAVEELSKAFEDAVIIAEATCFTRDIVNTIPDELHPPSFAKLAKKLAKENELECTVLDEKGLKKEKMNAMLAVGRASRHESQLIHLAYKPQNAKKRVALVGKGLTYDSGGLSLKPGPSMITMKMDKAGACATLGMIKAASELKLDIEVHVFIGAVENMIGGDAYKPDDVVVTRSGKTIEIRNTDAEGRVVLSDVLDYAQDILKEPDYIFDFATLTGACMVALGQYTTGVMGHSSELKHTINASAKKSGELTASLPFNRHLKKLLKSSLADISNMASAPFGGAITAGLFLDNFIKDENKDKWLHFDIAGSAYTEKPWDCNVYGATGAGVRMISEFLKELNDK